MRWATVVAEPAKEKEPQLAYKASIKLTDETRTMSAYLLYRHGVKRHTSTIASVLPLLSAKRLPESTTG
ncbi:hypothetical protein P4U99_23730 [Brevibacillus agri]|uniref:hypothetical protein n=1 Tax=Brevibacillus TaxID=55080 RepID=UPI00040D6E39|nr:MULTISPECIES: hypothetical protein [Brevibacillus]MDN4095803.1 hypothetical protein [Brevibacillus agri]MDR9507032.1 hypothetical protein [Brevibacillus agri]MED1646157.1 hypothetical protein [Brevibacillus agri]MED1656143.1 hypothetical protein [Brevibacillus agri]MED1689910.1 hypothetical protein [Brevibacillus agri]